MNSEWWDFVTNILLCVIRFMVVFVWVYHYMCMCVDIDNYFDDKG